MRLKTELIFKDRVGIVADLSVLLARHGINILQMEVVRIGDHAHIYMKTEHPDQGEDPIDLAELTASVEDLVRIRTVDSLPQEMREKRFRVVLDNISDGVISIDTEGRITTINKMARKAINCGDDDVVGRDVRALGLPDLAITRCLKGAAYSKLKKNLITGSGRYQYLATGRPIRDDGGRIIGAVEITKGVQEIKQMAKTITEPEVVSFSDIVGQDPSMMAAIAFAQKIAGIDAVVSICGASGTGKELFARAIHTTSGKSGPFIPINCAALPENLLESELFGYEGGAFTGGRKEGKPGLFEIAEDGTVFLDEIGEMPVSAQAKILRVIQDKRVRRIGGTQETAINTRVVTATNRNLEHLVSTGLFRKDLYYRINVLPIHIPPLSERRGDIPILAEHFLFGLSTRLGKAVPVISGSAMQKLADHDWPGNVRELRNVTERAAILCDGDRIDVDAILFSHELARAARREAMAETAPDEGRGALRERMALHEKRMLMQELESSPSIREAARRLGISHPTLLNKMKRYGLRSVKFITDGKMEINH